MSKAPKKKDEKPKIELEPDAWERFERFISEVAKKPPQHRPKVPKERKGE
jgi:hypothetical protein